MLIKNFTLACALTTLTAAGTLMAGPFVGGGITVGQSRPSSGDPGVSLGLMGEVGNNISISPFRHVMVGAELAKTVSRYRDDNDASSELDLLGMMFKAGYGYAPNDKAMITWEAGVGPTQADFSASKDDIDIESTKAAYGLNARIGVSAQMMLAEKFYGVAGLHWVYSSVDITSVKATAGGLALPADRFEGTASFNMPEAQIGLRADL
jgi:opacity protein-like surface antigen